MTTATGLGKNNERTPGGSEQRPNRSRPNGGVNFQRASCTLDASVKIYSCRVDTHQASYRILENLRETASRMTKVRWLGSESAHNVTLLPEGALLADLSTQPLPLLLSPSPSSPRLSRRGQARRRSESRLERDLEQVLLPTPLREPKGPQRQLS